MPTYEYICETCGHDLEIFQRMSDDPLRDCPACQAPALKRKIGTGAGIIFKGGGFYETDFKDRKGSGSKDGDSGKPDAKPEADSSGKARESTTESKSPSAATSAAE